MASLAGVPAAAFASLLDRSIPFNRDLLRLLNERVAQFMIRNGAGQIGISGQNPRNPIRTRTTHVLAPPRAGGTERPSLLAGQATMTFPSTSFHVPGFNPDFWRPYVPIVRNAPAVEAMDTDRTPDLSYSPQLHGDHANFVQSEDFKRYQQEVRDNLSFLVDFCRRHGVPDTEKIEENLDTFFSHRFDESHYFDKRAEIVDSIGKQSLDEFCSMVRNEAIETGKRTAAILNLSYGVTLCADGAISSLVSAACLLAKAAGGIRGKLWELKEEIAVHVLQQLMEQRFGQEEDYLDYEIHYVNTARNSIADDFGLEKTPDGTVLPEVALDDLLLESCTVGISRALTPDRLARLIAEDCHARFHSRLAMARIPPIGAWDTGIDKRFSEFLEEIGNELGLTSAGELELAPYAEASTLRESDLRMKSFFDIKQDDGLQGDENNASAYTYTVHTEPALIALDVLRAMDGLKLLRAQDGPKKDSEWMDENGMQAALFVYGELAWMVRTQPGENVQDPLWNSKNAGFGLITWPDLLRRQAARPDDNRPPPAAAIRQAIDVTAAEQLTQMPAHWLENADNLQRFLQRLDTGQAADYLTKNLRVINAIGTGFTNPERVEVLAHILHAGLGHAVRALISLWLQDQRVRTDMIYAVLLREAVPALHKAMKQEEPKAAIQAWYRPLRESGLLTAVASKVIDLLNTPYSDAPILWHALSNGQTAAVDAFLSLVKDLLKDSALQWNMKEGVLDLLHARDASGKPGLWKAMADGHTATVQAFYAGLENLLTDKGLADTIHPPLLWSLPDLLIGKKDRVDSGLAHAVQGGNTGVILALHTTLTKLLSHQHIAVHLQPRLDDMLAATLPGNASALSEAMTRMEHMAAIEAVYAMLKDPIIMLPVRRGMPNLLNRMDSNGKTGISNALEHGHAGIIDRYHALLGYLLRQSAVAQHIQGFLVPMLTARNGDGSTGLAYASEHGHTDAIAAYRAMLEDPVIFVHIQDHVADLLNTETLEVDRRDAASPDLDPDLVWSEESDAGMSDME